MCNIWIIGNEYVSLCNQSTTINKKRCTTAQPDVCYLFVSLGAFVTITCTQSRHRYLLIIKKRPEDVWQLTPASSFTHSRNIFSRYMMSRSMVVSRFPHGGTRSTALFTQPDKFLLKEKIIWCLKENSTAGKQEQQIPPCKIKEKYGSQTKDTGRLLER